MDDDKLLKRAIHGDETAFLLLYKQHSGALYRFIYRLLGSTEIAEDIAHDCFLSLIRQPKRFDPERASLRTYLFAAARNLAFKHLRRTGNEVLLDEVSEEPRQAGVGEPLGRLLAKELAQRVRQAVAGLPPLQREALILFEYEELSLAEIAEVVGADVGAVKARLHRARAPAEVTLPLLEKRRTGDDCGDEKL
jgi:RNA polymerase sigma-70 factor, ECF subfamily